MRRVGQVLAAPTTASLLATGLVGTASAGGGGSNDSAAEPIGDTVSDPAVATLQEDPGAA